MSSSSEPIPWASAPSEPDGIPKRTDARLRLPDPLANRPIRRTRGGRWGQPVGPGRRYRLPGRPHTSSRMAVAALQAAAHRRLKGAADGVPDSGPARGRGGWPRLGRAGGSSGTADERPRSNGTNLRGPDRPVHAGRLFFRRPAERHLRVAGGSPAGGRSRRLDRRAAVATGPRTRTDRCSARMPPTTSRVPHSPQNLRRDEFAVPQFVQVTRRFPAAPPHRPRPVVRRGARGTAGHGA